MGKYFLVYSVIHCFTNSDRAFFDDVNPYDNHGHKTGHSNRALGGGVNHYDEKGHKTGYSGRSIWGGINHYGDDDSNA